MSPRPGVIDIIHGAGDVDAFADRALCRGTGDTLDWFPERGDNAMVNACKALCAECPVQPECLEVGLRQRDGIWGGTSGRERRGILRARGWRFKRCGGCRVLMLVERQRAPFYCTDECQQRATHARKNEWHRNNGTRKEGPQIAANERGRG